MQNENKSAQADSSADLPRDLADGTARRSTTSYYVSTDDVVAAAGGIKMLRSQFHNWIDACSWLTLTADVLFSQICRTRLFHYVVPASEERLKEWSQQFFGAEVEVKRPYELRRGKRV